MAFQVRASKWYSVRRGHVQGVYTKWSDVLSQITGYSKPEFKAFTSESGALRHCTYGPEALAQPVTVKVVTPSNASSDCSSSDNMALVPSTYIRYKIHASPGPGPEWRLSITSSGACPEYLEVPSAIGHLGRSFVTLYGVIRVLETFNVRTNVKKMGVDPESAPDQNTRLDVCLQNDVHAFNILSKYMASWKRNGWADSRGKEVKGRDLLEALEALASPLVDAHVLHVLAC